MDSSAKGQTKGTTPKKPVTSRTSLSRVTKTGGPSSSPKVATESPGPAASRHPEPISRPAAKVTTGAKEAAVSKTSTIRTVATSPIKSRTLQQKDPVSPIKPRQLNGDKGTQKTASPVPTKSDAAKKCVEGSLRTKPKAPQEGDVSTPLKRNGAIKREAGKLPEQGAMPKDKSPALRPEKNVPMPVKALVSSSVPAKPIKAPSVSTKPTEKVPATDKPANSTSLSAKAARSPSTPTRPSSSSSATAKTIKTLSPLVKTAKASPVSSKPAKTPIASVNKPGNTLPGAAKPAKPSPIKSVSTTMTTNSIKQGKLTPVNKQTSVSAKLPAAKAVKSVPSTGKPVNGKGVPPKVPMKAEPSNSSGKPLQATDLTNQSNTGMNVKKHFDMPVNHVNAAPGPVNLPDELVDTLAVLVNKDSEHRMVDNVETAEELVEESTLAVEAIKPSVVTGEVLGEPHLVHPEVDLSDCLEQIVKSPIKHVTPIEVENNWGTVTPLSEDISSPEKQLIVPKEKNLVLELSKPLEEEVKNTVEHLEEEQYDMEEEVPLDKTDNLFRELQKSPVEPLLEEMSPQDIETSSEESDNPSVEVIETQVVPLQDEISHLSLKNSPAETDKCLVEVESPVEALEGEVSNLDLAKLSKESEPLAEVVETPLQEEMSHLDLAKPLAEVVKSPNELMQEEMSPLDLANIPVAQDELLEEVVESPVEALQEEKSPLDEGKSIEESDRPIVEIMKTSVSSFQEDISHLDLENPLDPTPFESLQEEMSQLNLAKPIAEVVKTPIEPLQEDTFLLDLAKPVAETDNTLIDIVKTSVKEASPLGDANLSAETDNTLVDVMRYAVEPLQEVVTSMDLEKSSEERCTLLDDMEFLNDEPHIPMQTLDEPMKPLDVLEEFSGEPAINLEEFRTDLVKPMEESVSLSEKKGDYVDETTQLIPLDKDLKSPVDELLEEEFTSSLEQVTPLGEDVDLLDDGIVSEVPSGLLSKQQVGNPVNQNQNYPEALTSSTEVSSSSSDEEEKPLKGEEETLNIRTPEYEGIEEVVTCSIRGLNQTDLALLSSTVKPLDISVPAYPVEETLTSPNNSEIYLNNEQTTSREQFQTLFEPFKNIEETYISPSELLKPAVQNTDECSYIVENVTYLEGSHSPVEFEEPIKYPEDIEGSAEEPQNLIEQDDKSPETTPVISLLEKEKETPLVKSPVETCYPIGPFSQAVEYPEYDAEQDSGSTMECIENVWDNKAADMDKEEPLTELVKPAEVTSEYIDEPVHKMNKSLKEPSDYVMTMEKQCDSAQMAIYDASSPIKPSYSDLQSELFPEEPLTSVKDLETALSKMDKYSEVEMQSSLEQVKCANIRDADSKVSTWELTSVLESPVISAEKSFITLSEVADTGVRPQLFQNTDVDVKELVEKSCMPDTLPGQQHNDLLESRQDLTTVDIAPVDILSQFEESIANNLASVESDALKPREDPLIAESEETQNRFNIPVVTTKVEIHPFNDLLDTLEQPLSAESVVTAGGCTIDLKTITPESERSLNKSIPQQFTVFSDPDEQIWNINTDSEHCFRENNSSQKEELNATRDAVSFTAEETKPVSVEATNPIDASVDSMVPPAEETEALSAGERCDVLLYPAQAMAPLDYPQECEKEPWVLVQKEELADFNETMEDRPLRPASLSQEGEMQEEQTKAEEDVGERASVCSTLSDPQLAGQSSSETSTPEELKTYEDTSSGVESHSDDVATSPQTTLTPDPDLGIHMGQEEGADTPAGTPASNSKRVPHPLQGNDIEGQSQETSPSAIFESSESDPIVRKREVTTCNFPMTSTLSREEKNEEGTEARGAQRGEPCPITSPSDGLYTIYESERGPQERSPRGAELGLVEQMIGRTLLLAASDGGDKGRCERG